MTVIVSTCRRTSLEDALGSTEGVEVRGLDAITSADVLWISKSTRASTGGPFVREALAANPGLRVVMWDGDVREQVPDHIKEHGGEIDVLLVGHRDMDAGASLHGKWARDIGTFYHGVNPRNFPAPTNRGNGVFFGGSNYLGRDDEYPLSKFRADLVDAFRRSEFGFELSGHYWVAGRTFAPVLDSHRYCMMMQRSAVTLGCNHFDLEGYYTKRLFDSLAAGRLHLTRYIPGMEQDFKNHLHLVWFREIDEALDLAAWYLSHDSEREFVAKSGRDLVMREHTVDHRAHKLAKGLRYITGKRFGHAG